MDEWQLAAYQAAHKFSGKVPELAKRLAMNAGTLNNKLDPAQPAAELKVSELLALMLVCDDFSPLAALAADCDHATVPVDSYPNLSCRGLMQLFADYTARVGETASTLLAIPDGVGPSEQNIADLRRTLFQDFSAGMALLNRAEAEQ